MKTYTFNANDINTSSFLGNTHTNYSEMLNNIIVNDVIKKNSYLFGNRINVNSSSSLKDNATEFAKAATYLASYKKPNNKLNIVIGKTYSLADGTPIIFYDDEIQIGFDIFKYSDFAMSSFLENIKPSTKKIIIDIYTNSNTINININ